MSEHTWAFLDPDPTRTPDEHLWALDLDEDGLPRQAHLIVEPAETPKDDAWPEVMVAACGRRFTSAHSHGWWGSNGTSLPIDRRAICCGLEQIEGQR